MAYTEIIDDGDQVILRNTNFEVTYKKVNCSVFLNKERKRIEFLANNNDIKKQYIIYTLDQINEWGFSTAEELYEYLTNIIKINSSDSGIPDAPNDGKIYGRQNESWQEVIYPNIIEEPTLAGFKFFNEDVYSIYVEGANFETSNLSDYNIGIGVEVHRANVLDACGNSQGVVFYYTLGDNLCEEGYSSGGEVCVPNFHSEDDMIDYIYYNNDSCIETIEWTGTQITSSINLGSDDYSIVIGDNPNLVSIKTVNVTTLNHNNIIFSNQTLTTLDQGALTSVGGGNEISDNNALTTIDQVALTSVGGYNEIYDNPALTTIDQVALASVGGTNYISDNQALTSIDQGALASVGGDNYITSNPVLTTLDQGALTSVGGYNYISSNQALTSIDQKALTSIGGYNEIYDNPALTTIIVASSLTFTNVNNNSQINAVYNNNALDQTTVDAICDAILAGSTVIPISGAYLRLDGGTNAIPSGTRITDLQIAGWTVATN